MQNINQVINSYSNSTVNKTIKKQYSKTELLTLLESFRDVCPKQDGYDPHYVRQMETLGVDRFTELVNKARAGSDTPAKLFNWFLKNPTLVK